jgi:hypothetical protein
MARHLPFEQSPSKEGVHWFLKATPPQELPLVSPPGIRKLCEDKRRTAGARTMLELYALPCHTVHSRCASHSHSVTCPAQRRHPDWHLPLRSAPTHLKMAPSVLFFRPKTSRTRPSHCTKLMGGGGFRGSMRTTLLSTWGGGRKLALPTCVRSRLMDHMDFCLLVGQEGRPDGTRWRVLGSAFEGRIQTAHSAPLFLFMCLGMPCRCVRPGARLEQMVDARKQLGIGGQPAVHWLPRARHQAHCKLVLRACGCERASVRLVEGQEDGVNGGGE